MLFISNKTKCSNAKSASMSCNTSKLNRISFLLLLGIIFEFASLVAFTEAVPFASAEDLSYNAGYKRAGFVGMRGKKSDIDLDSPWPELPKRAGFVGMRGKKGLIVIQYIEPKQKNIY